MMRKNIMNQYQHPSPQEIEEALGLSPAKRRGRWMKRMLWLALLLLALATAAYFIVQMRQNVATVSYETVPVQKSDLTVTVSATGTIQPLSQVDIGSELSGVVREVLVDVNQSVRKGEVLAVLDPTRLQAQRAQIAAQIAAAEANIADVEAALAEKKLSLARQQTLRKKGLATGQEFETAGTALLRAKASVDAAVAGLAAEKAQLTIIDADIEKTRIISPIDGIVLKREVEPGQTVAASLQAPVLFQIAQDLTRIRLEAAVDEADIGQVSQGQSASFTVDAYRGRSFPAMIERLSFAPETVDGVVTYKALLSAANDDLALRPGMTATARIIVAEYKQVLTIANEALRYQPPVVKPSEGFSLTELFMPRFPRANRGKRQQSADGLQSLYVLRDNAPVELRVKIGASDGKVTQITADGLKIDDPIISGQKQVRKP